MIEYTGNTLRNVMAPQRYEVYVDDKIGHEMSKETFDVINEFMEDIVSPSKLTKEDFEWKYEICLLIKESLFSYYFYFNKFII